MNIHSAEFICSNTELNKMPETQLPEYAFIGRSNVGKSSLINRLTQKKGLAKTSQTPGKTQLINHFLINEKFYLVDLPGYGYARVSKTAKEKWGKFIARYLEKRKELQGVFVLIDSRLEPQKIDLEFIHWIAERSIPLVITFTKSDKQNPGKTAQTVKKFLNEMDTIFTDTPRFVITSAEKGDGMEELMDIILQGNSEFIPEILPGSDFNSPLNPLETIE
jgi:GTP-binding protein